MSFRCVAWRFSWRLVPLSSLPRPPLPSGSGRPGLLCTTRSHLDRRTSDPRVVASFLVMSRASHRARLRCAARSSVMRTGAISRGYATTMGRPKKLGPKKCWGDFAAAKTQRRERPILTASGELNPAKLRLVAKIGRHRLLTKTDQSHHSNVGDLAARCRPILATCLI